MKQFKILDSLTIILLISFVGWSWAVAERLSFIHQFDSFWIDLIYHNHTGIPMIFLRSITEAGGTIGTIIITLLFLILLTLFKYYYAAIFLIVNKIAVVLINTLVKSLVQRPRPNHHHYMFEGSFSYPSGHSSSALSLYIPLLIIGFFIFKKVSTRILISTITILLVIIIGYSRVYLGVHYPSDVLGAYLLAGGVLTASIILFRSKQIFVLDLKGIKQQRHN